MRNHLVLAVCFLLFSAAPSRAEFYRWVDKDGKEFYTNELKQVPQEYRDHAAVVKPDSERVNRGGNAVAPDGPGGPVREHRDKYGRGEEYWRKRAQNIRLKLRDQQDEYDLVIKQLDQDEKPKKSAGKKKKSGSSLGNKKIKLEQDMAKMRRLLEVDLPEEARRADAYPGWLRE